MQIIPVIDIRNGAVMRARAGDRDSYRPIAVAACGETSAPADVVAGFLTLHSLEKIYIADLDALEGSGDNRDEIGVINRGGFRALARYGRRRCKRPSTGAALRRIDSMIRQQIADTTANALRARQG